MAAVTGAATNAILKVGSTFGTAVTGGSGDKLAFTSMTASLGETVLEAVQLGSGIVMSKDATKGAIAPTINITMPFGARNLADLLCFGFFLADSAAEGTPGEGDYRHRMTYATTPANWLTFAHDRSSSTVTEYPSCLVRRITISVASVPGYVSLEAELLGNTRLLTGTTNDNSELAASTVPTDTELFAAAFDDYFWINTQSGGSLSTSNALPITSFSITLERPLEFVGEIKGTSGNSQARSSGQFNGEMTVTLKDNSESVADWFAISDAETAYKARFSVNGTAIANGGNRSLSVYCPRMKLISSPIYDLADPGHNPLTLTWKLFAATTAPTGMDSVYPYVEVVNTKSSALSS